MFGCREDGVPCVWTGGGLWLIDSRREGQQSRSVVSTGPADLPPAAPHMVWLRDGSTRIRIQPRDILWIGSAGNYVECRHADGTSHIVRPTVPDVQCCTRPA